MENTIEPIQNILLEMRRGVIVLAVLGQLRREQYGYSLLGLLAEQGLEIDQGTLYPLLRRLEAQGLVQSAWRVEGETRPRRYYVLSPAGRETLARLQKEWNLMTASVNKILKGQ